MVTTSKLCVLAATAITASATGVIANGNAGGVVARHDPQTVTVTVTPDAAALCGSSAVIPPAIPTDVTIVPPATTRAPSVSPSFPPASGFEERTSTRVANISSVPVNATVPASFNGAGNKMVGSGVVGFVAALLMGLV